MKRTCILAVLAIACSGSASNADIITFAYEGTLTPPLPGPVFGGPTTFSGTYSFDSLAVNTSSTRPAVYALEQFTFRAGSFMGTWNTGEIRVADLLPGTPAFELDWMDVIVSGPSVEGTADGGFLALVFINDDGTAFSSADLPLVPPPLSAFDSAVLFNTSYLGSIDPSWEVHLSGTIDSLTLVPVPSAVSLGVLGLGLAGLLKRKTPA